MVVGCHQQPTIAAIFFDNGSHIIGNIPTESDAANSAVVSVRTPSPNNQGINLHSFSPSRIQNLLRACIKLTGVFPTATPYLLAALTSTLL
jgi:hypothetical protein